MDFDKMFEEMLATLKSIPGGENNPSRRWVREYVRSQGEADAKDIIDAFRKEKNGFIDELDLRKWLLTGEGAEDFKLLEISTIIDGKYKRKVTFKYVGPKHTVGDKKAEHKAKEPKPEPELALHSFSEALSALKEGAIAWRKGWNGKGIYVQLQRPDAHSKMTMPYIYMVTNNLVTDNPYARKGLVPWLASQTDLLAEDWVIER